MCLRVGPLRCMILNPKMLTETDYFTCVGIIHSALVSSHTMQLTSMYIRLPHPASYMVRVSSFTFAFCTVSLQNGTRKFLSRKAVD